MAVHKTFFGKIFGWIGDIFHKAETELVPVILPFISNLLNGIKAVVDNPLVQEAVSFIPGNLPEEIFTKLQTILPKVAQEWNLVIDLTNVKTPADMDAALQKVFAELKLPDDIARQKFLSSFGARVLQEIQNHEMTFAQAVIDVEYFWENYVNNKAA